MYDILLEIMKMLLFPQQHIAYLQQKCHNSKICDFSGETFKGFEVLLSAVSATTTQLLSSGEFCKLRFDSTCSKCISKRFFLYQ